MKKIYYLCFYDVFEAKYKRNYVNAAITKINYIADCFINIGYTVDIISASWIKEKKIVFSTGSKTEIKPNLYLKKFFSFGTKNRIFGALKILLAEFFILIKLFSLNQKDILVVYHTPWLSLPVQIAKKIKKFQLILEIEEVYADISSQGKFFDKQEYKLFSIADAYILSTELLISRLNIKKPYVVIYGKYKRESLNNNDNNNNLKIHLLYSGIIDRKKAGAFNALYASQYLNEQYELHIVGFGEIDLLIKEIEKINRTNTCKVFYDGLLNGEEYINYCKKFDIGLATQTMKGEYLNSSFPSKILMYLSVGLNVVSGKIKCVEISKVNNVINYYEIDDPSSIATAIKNATIFPKSDIITIIDELNIECQNNLIQLFNSLKK